MSETQHDVVVVGGRIAGALTAAFCAARGMTVLVLEARERLGDTPSTHFFRGEGLVRALGCVGILADVLASGAPPLRRELFYLGGSARFAVNPPQEPGDLGHSLSVRRETLDEMLAAHVAQLPGVEYRAAARVTELLEDDGRVVGVRTSHGSAHHASLTVGADGSRSVIAGWADAQDRERHPGARAIYYRYVSGWQSADANPVDAAEFSLLDNEMAYVFPSDGHATCVALSVSLDTYLSARHDAAGTYEERLRAHAGLWPRYRDAQQLGRLHASPPEDSVVREPAGPGWALVGDAATHQDPWSGLGMDTAARHAEALADALATASDTSTDEWIKTYANAYDQATLNRFRMTTDAAPDLRVLVE